MDPELTARLLALPALREQAERDAAESLENPSWSMEVMTAYHARLLADLTRWQSQAWALREIGRLLGGDVRETVPQITVMIFSSVNIWSIEVRGQHHNFSDLRDLPADRPAAIAAILLHLSGAA